MALTGPQRTVCAEDRVLRCEEDLEAEFQSLIEKATQAGWSEGEACTAIASLADHYILARLANDRMMSEVGAQRTTGMVIKAQRR